LVAVRTEMSQALLEKFPDVKPFLLKKWERVFNAFFDRNASNEVDWGDFYLVTKYVRDIYGAQSEQMQLAKSSMKALWDGLLAMGDKNKDERVQIEEWIAVLKIGADDQKAEPKWFLDYMTFMFKLMDVSADNRLDISEYADGLATYGFDREDAHNAFKKFAVDAKGKPVQSIDFPAYKKLWQEYFYSTDENAKGNWLFGTVA